MAFGLSTRQIIAAIALPILLTTLFVGRQSEIPSIVTEDDLFEDTGAGLELIQKKALKTVSSPSKIGGEIANLPESVISPESLEMDTRTQIAEQNTVAAAVKADLVTRTKKDAKVIKIGARANETRDSCATCYNGQHDGACISNPNFGGACTNPSGTFYCRLGGSFGAFPVDSCGAAPPQHKNDCSSCYNGAHDGACISNPQYQGKCTDPSGSIYCQLGGPNGRFPVDTCSYEQGYCGSCYNGDHNGLCISNAQYGGACTDPGGSNYCQLGGPSGAFPVSSCGAPPTTTMTTTTTTACLDLSGTYDYGWGTTTLSQVGCSGTCVDGWSYTVSGNMITLDNGITGVISQGGARIEFSNGYTYTKVPPTPAPTTTTPAPTTTTPAPTTTTTTTTTTMKITTTTTMMEECIDFCAGFAADATWEVTCQQAGYQCAACTKCKELKEGGGDDFPSSGGGDFQGGLDLLAAKR